ncbi:MAG: hypothetical protein GY737_13970 [Desulfobacteraceae bacterium]|nr:hypothetical protein [Desulfobacteraceae bacterium]
MDQSKVEDLVVFGEVMGAIAEEFGGKLSKDNMKLRFKCLAGYSIKQIRLAGTWLFKHREKTYPAVPTTKEIIDAIEAISHPERQIDVRSRAEVQADLVLAKLRREGRNAAVDFEDPVTFHLMTIRWPYNSWGVRVTEEGLLWWRKYFIDAYRAYNEVREVYPQALPPGIVADRIVALARTTVRRIES